MRPSVAEHLPKISPHFCRECSRIAENVPECSELFTGFCNGRLGGATGQVKGRTVRVAGTLQSYDANVCRAVIEDEGAAVEVDTNLLGSEPLRIGQVVQMIGECDFLQVRVAGCVCGLWGDFVQISGKENSR